MKPAELCPLMVDKMPAFPKSVQKILELTRNVNCRPKDLIGVIEKDPVITIKILKVINSAYYRLPGRVSSVNQAVVYLGINTVKNLALGFAAVGVLPRSNQAGFDIQHYLLHSLVVAGMARQLATQFATKEEVDPGDCYIVGLLHDFGKVVFAQFLHREFRAALTAVADQRIPLHVAERDVIGLDHGVVGAMLAKRWQFPDHLVDCIRDHHDEARTNTPMMDCLRAADQVARFKGIGDARNPWWEDEVPANPERFGPDIETLVSKLEDLERITDEARLFSQASG